MSEGQEPKPECPATPANAYAQAIEAYRQRRQELSDCEIEIDVSRILKDTAALRVALSKQNRLREAVNLAMDEVQNAAVDVVRFNAMAAPREDKPEGKGMLSRMVEIVSKIVKP